VKAAFSSQNDFSYHYFKQFFPESNQLVQFNAPGTDQLKKTLPAWKTVKESSQATAVVYKTMNTAHFQLPASRRIAATTPMQGKYVRIKSMNEKAARGVNSFFPSASFWD
jgi:hypothetical protein